MLLVRRVTRRRRILWIVVLCFACTFGKGLVFGEYRVGNSSSPPVYPTPLMVLLNASDVASLKVQLLNASDVASLKAQGLNVTNSVSNTNLNDLYKDNDTQQMQIRYRERKRQERLLLIQRDILQKLGLSQEPNVTSGLSDEERQRMFQLFNRSYYIEHEAENEVQGTNQNEDANPS